MQPWSSRETLRGTFGDEGVSVRARHRAVDLANQLHVVEESIEGIEVGEADHVGGAPSCSLWKDPKACQTYWIGGVVMDLTMFSHG